MASSSGLNTRDMLELERNPPAPIYKAPASLNFIEMNELTCNPPALIRSLQEWGLIASSVKCPNCGHDKHLVPVTSADDGFVWMCKNPEYKNNMNERVECFDRISIRRNTFFDKSHLSLIKILWFVHGWIAYHRSDSIMGAVAISHSTYADWDSYCRELMIHSCLARSTPIGGPGTTVQIDESKFGVGKYLGGQWEGQWVVGGFEKVSRSFFLRLVEQRDAATLVSLIESCILPGTTVAAKCWRSSNILNELDFKQLATNHSVNFEGRQTNTAMKTLWRHRRYLMPHNHWNKEFFAEYLAKYMFINRARRQNLDITVEFLRAVGSLYKSDISTLPVFVAGVRSSESDSEEYPDFWM